jgi:hypothetical protein
MSRRRERQYRRSQKRNTPTAAGLVRVNVAALAPYNSYGAPDFVARGYYLDVGFTCAGCGSKETWRAAQQKWWYEVMKGYVYSAAKLCRSCRRREQARRGDARRTHMDGLRKKRGV